MKIVLLQKFPGASFSSLSLFGDYLSTGILFVSVSCNLLPVHVQAEWQITGMHYLHVADLQPLVVYYVLENSLNHT